jgi:two-component system response regulator FlrC
MLSSPQRRAEQMGETHARPNVLIVEDERVSRRALTALMAASGYATEAAGSAEEALAAVRADAVHPDIALVDLDLPGMNGLELIGQLTRMEPSVFPVLITAANGDSLTHRLREQGVAYLRKPVDFGRLLSLLNTKTAN